MQWLHQLTWGERLVRLTWRAGLWCRALGQSMGREVPLPVRRTQAIDFFGPVTEQCTRNRCKCGVLPLVNYCTSAMGRSAKLRGMACLLARNRVPPEQAQTWTRRLRDPVSNLGYDRKITGAEFPTSPVHWHRAGTGMKDMWMLLLFLGCKFENALRFQRHGNMERCKAGQTILNLPPKFCAL